jgi:hypothetical protein
VYSRLVSLGFVLAGIKAVLLLKCDDALEVSCVED